MVLLYLYIKYSDAFLRIVSPNPIWISSTLNFRFVVSKLRAIAELLMLTMAVIKHRPRILAIRVQNSASLIQMLSQNT